MDVVILSLHLVFVHVATVWILLQWDLRLINRINKAQESPAFLRGFLFNRPRPIYCNSACTHSVISNLISCHTLCFRQRGSTSVSAREKSVKPAIAWGRFAV